MCTQEEKQAQIPHRMTVKIQRLENELQISTAGAKKKGRKLTEGFCPEQVSASINSQPPSG